MDTGIKRLWSRKKSWGAADQPGNSRKLSSSNGISTLPTSSVSTAKDGRPSMTSIRQLVRPFNQDKTEKPQEQATTNGDELGRTKSGHRIQPMLVGISRPETAINRPGTSGSLQSAVQRAADSVGRQPPDISVDQPVLVPTKSHKSRSAPSRHVDIFSAAASITSKSSRYNEEIAERNLDMYRLALENTPHIYDPASKYQEEVAIRNAYLPYKTRPSLDTPRQPSDYDRTTSMTNRSIRNVVSSQSNGNVSYQQSTDATTSQINNRSDQVSSQHIRQLSTHSRDGAAAPATSQAPQLHLDQHAILRDNGLQMTTQAPYSPTRSSGGMYNSRDAKMSTIQEGSPYEIRTYSITRTPMLRDSGHSSSGFSDYQVSTKEYGRSALDRSGVVTDRGYDVSKGLETQFNAPSTYSISSSVKRSIILPNRTIMDLTNDDTEMFSEASSAFGYSQYSPIIEQARSDAFKRIEPSQIHTETRRASSNASQILQGTTAPDREFSEPEFEPEAAFEVETKVQTYIESQLQAGSRSTALGIHLERRLPSPSGFSPISTLASWSPRSSAYIAKPPEMNSMTTRVAAALEAARAASKDGSASSAVRKDTEIPTVKERVASYESNSERGNPSPNAQESAAVNVSRKASPPAQEPNSIQTHPPEGDVADTSMTEPGTTREITPITRKSTIPEEADSPIVEKVSSEDVVAEPAQTTRIDVASTPSAKSLEKMPQTPSIYTSPDSITSVDYINPSTAFGVRTRDFAISPRRVTPPPTAIEKVPVVKPAPRPTTAPSRPPQNKQKRARASKTTTPAPKSVDTGFDEEAFARKRAEARAALEKLQRSLSENFLTLPTDRSAIKGKQRLVESQPVTPTPALTLPQEVKPTRPVSNQRISAASNLSIQRSSVGSNPAVQRTSTGSNFSIQRSESEKPPPSAFRTSREMQQSSSLTSNRSLSTGSRSSRKALGLSSLKNVEPAINPIDQNILSPALLQALQGPSKPPKSPGEISLSSFPVPSSSRPPSQPDTLPGLHSHNNSIASVMKRRNSTKSQGSTASAYSIPLHMVPGRTSSVRDPVPEEVDPVWG